MAELAAQQAAAERSRADWLVRRNKGGEGRDGGSGEGFSWERGLEEGCRRRQQRPSEHIGTGPRGRGKGMKVEGLGEGGVEVVEKDFGGSSGM